MKQDKSSSTQQQGTISASNSLSISETAINFSPEKHTKSTSSMQPEIFQCKICLAEVISTTKSKQKIISPCTCTGSMKYVHNQCLVSWLNSIVKRNLQLGVNTYNISCQICKFPYQYQTTYKFACIEAAEVKQQIKLNWGVFFLGLLFICSALVGSIILGVQVAEKKLVINKEGSPLQIMFIAAIVLFGIIVIVWSLRLTYIFLIRKIYFVKKVFEKEKPQKSNIDNSNNTINISM